MTTKAKAKLLDDEKPQNGRAKKAAAPKKNESNVDIRVRVPKTWLEDFKKIMGLETNEQLEEQIQNSLKQNYIEAKAKIAANQVAQQTAKEWSDKLKW